MQAKRLQPVSAWEAFSRWRSFSVSSGWSTTFSDFSYVLLPSLYKNLYEKSTQPTGNLTYITCLESTMTEKLDQGI
jgi:hypothetical protein